MFEKKVLKHLTHNHKHFSRMHMYTKHEDIMVHSTFDGCHNLTYYISIEHNFQKPSGINLESVLNCWFLNRIMYYWYC